LHANQAQPFEQIYSYDHTLQHFALWFTSVASSLYVLLLLLLLLLQLSEFHLSDWVRLDTCVTVVDASVFLDNLHSIEELRDR
jgi:hypothetical protein